jgi:hypothetical protein
METRVIEMRRIVLPALESLTATMIVADTRPIPYAESGAGAGAVAPRTVTIDPSLSLVLKPHSSRNAISE